MLSHHTHTHTYTFARIRKFRRQTILWVSAVNFFFTLISWSIDYGYVLHISVSRRWFCHGNDGAASFAPKKIAMRRKQNSAGASTILRVWHTQKKTVQEWKGMTKFAARHQAKKIYIFIVRYTGGGAWECKRVSAHTPPEQYVCGKVIILNHRFICR